MTVYVWSLDASRDAPRWSVGNSYPTYGRMAAWLLACRPDVVARELAVSLSLVTTDKYCPGDDHLNVVEGRPGVTTWRDHQFTFRFLGDPT